MQPHPLLWYNSPGAFHAAASSCHRHCIPTYWSDTTHLDHSILLPSATMVPAALPTVVVPLTWSIPSCCLQRSYSLYLYLLQWYHSPGAFHPAVIVTGSPPTVVIPLIWSIPSCCLQLSYSLYLYLLQWYHSPGAFHPAASSCLVTVSPPTVVIPLIWILLPPATMVPAATTTVVIPLTMNIPSCCLQLS